MDDHGSYPSYVSIGMGKKENKICNYGGLGVGGISDDSFELIFPISWNYSAFSQWRLVCLGILGWASIEFCLNIVFLSLTCVTCVLTL